jgi:hypothetical protein
MMTKFLLFAALLLSSFFVPAQTFQEVAAAVGITHTLTGTNYGSGISFCDFNNDGWDDLTLGSGKGDSIAFYLNINGVFQKIVPSLVSHTEESKQVLWADYDNDGDKDLFVTTYKGTSRLYNNNGNLQMSDVTLSAGLSLIFHDTFGAAWGDVNNDGWLDLYVNNWNNTNETNILYLNAGNGTFIDITLAANASDSNRFSFCNAFFDYDKDGDQDIYIANDKFSRNTLLRNNGDATFTDVSTSTGSALTMDAMCVTVGDFNNDLYSDIYITNGPGGGNKLLRSNGSSGFSTASASLGVAVNGDCWGSNFIDFNNDAFQDVYVSSSFIGNVTGQNTLLRNHKGMSFSVPVAGLDADTVESYSNAIGDFNNDGFADFVTQNESPFNAQLWENSGNTNNWIKIALEGRVSNRDGIGSWIEVHAGALTVSHYTHCGIGYLAQNSATTIIGLDTNSSIDSIVVRWLSGHVDRLYTLSPNQKITIIEGSTLAFYPKLQASASIVCEGDSVVLFLNKEYKAYDWAGGQKSKTIRVILPGSYSVSVTNSFGFQRNSDTLIITTFPNTLKLDLYAKPVTATAPNGMAYATVTGGNPPYIFKWNDANKQSTDTAFELYPGTYKLLVKDADRCAVEKAIQVQSAVGIGSHERSTLALYAFPSPANEELFIEWNKTISNNITLSIHDMHGIEIKQLTIKNHSHHILDVSTLPNGLYVISVKGNGLVENERILVQH